MKNGKLTGQVAVVTGASKGIGAGIAKALGAEGASVVVNYSSSKEGADRVVQEIVAKELGARKIRVNSINPGLIETEGVHTQGNDEGDFRKWVETQSPLGRIGQPDDISPTAVYVASSDSKYMTGETVRVTGGI